MHRSPPKPTATSHHARGGCRPRLAQRLGRASWGLVVVGPAATAEPAGGHRVEAEEPRPNSTSYVVDIPADQGGGQAVTSDKAWEPIFRTSDFGRWEGRATVWVRHSGGPINLKLEMDGEQRDTAWVWSEPATMTWSKLGTFERGALGEAVIIIRGEQGAPQIDAVTFEPVDGAATDPGVAAPAAAPAPSAGELPSAIPAADVPAVEVSLLVDWSRSGGPITALHWAVNDYSVLKPDLAGQPAFNGYVRELNPGAIRLHWAGLVDTWTDAATRTWDAETMKANLDAAVGFGAAPLMVCVNWWPKWLHEGEVLPEEKEAEFIKLCAALPGVLRGIGHPAAMIELPNEREGHYEQAGRLPALWSLYKRCVEAIRAADGDVLVGGPALTWPKPQWLLSFIEHGGLASSDFVTWHNYGSGEATDPNDRLFAAADRIGGHAADAMRMIRDAGYPDMPGYLTEFNVSWTWTTRDARMGNNVGAVFQALVVKKLAEAGADGAFVWHLQDNIYGLLKTDGTRRAPAQLYLWHEHLAGTMSPVVSELPDAIEGLAVRHDDGGRALLLMVKADRPVRLHLNDTLTAGPVPGAAWATVDAIVPEGFEKPRWDGAASVELPGYSVVLLSTRN